MMKTVIKKELRGYFNSLVASIFLTVFVAVTLASVFWWQKFFARGLADLRPLFFAMPLLLIIVASVLSMRMWAEERRTGTLEILLTLPVPRWQLVVGKFLAGMVLIAVALALTLELPITIAFMGNLDLGPVIGGYLAALLLSAVYLSIGMCVSALTDNQIVSFIATAALCAIAYLIGYLGEIGHIFGTGARFESVARGVLDLRDLAYYGGVIAFAIVLNVVLLQRLTWGHGEHGRARRMGALLGVALVALNAIALDVWLSPVRRARIDLTQDGTYSLSESTEKILAGLDERLLIRGYFSEKTHPKLAPLVPQIRDLLEEYKVAGGGKVRVEIVDPGEDDEAKREAKDRFGIDPRPLQFASQTEKALINAYFAIAIEYGNQHSVIGLEDLIAVRSTDIGDVEITLKNPEYELTKTIKKTVSEFSSVDAMFAATTGKVKLTAYLTPGTLPTDWKDAPAKLKKVVDDLTKQSGGKLEFVQVEPKTETEQRELYSKYGLRPFPDLETGQMYYFDMLMQVGNRLVRIAPPQNMSEADLKAALTEGLKRAAPGFTRVVGLWSPPPAMMPPQMPGMQPQEMPIQQFHTLRRSLAGNYEVRDIQLSQPIPEDVEALVVAGPSSIDPKSAENLDQFVMRGGALVLLDGRYRIAPGMGEGLGVDKVTTGLEAMLQKWGVTVGDDMVWDTKAETFPMPAASAPGSVRELRQLPLPYFVKMDGDQVSSASPITNGLAGSIMHWVSPIKADAKVGDDAHRVDVLLKTSPGSWLSTNTMVQPDLRQYPESGFPGPAKDLAADKKGSQVVAVAVVGGFASSAAKPAGKPQPGAKDAERLLEHSPPDARIVVFGSSSFASDEMLGMAQQLGSELAMSNIELVHNAVDWSLADTELLAIRSRNEAARALTVEASSASNWIVANVVIAIVGLIVVVVVLPWLRRRSITPIVVAKEA